MSKTHETIRWICALLLCSCAGIQRQESSKVKTATPSVSGSSTSDNVLLHPWSGPYGGVPAFAQVRTELLAPALLQAMAQARTEIDAIANNAQAPSFANTIEALEDAQRALQRVETYYGVWESTMSDAVFQALEREMAPKLAAFADEINQNERLFARIAAVYAATTKSPGTSGLDAEQQRLVWRHYTDMVMGGAQLRGADKQRFAELNQHLAQLHTSFGQNVLHDEESYRVVIDSEADLAGLPDSVRAAAAAAAEERGLHGKWLVANTRSAVEPFLMFSARRPLREKVWRNFVARGDNGDAHDNNAIVSEILALRAQRAKLLGFPSHAHWRLQDSMAKTPEAAVALMEAVWKPAVARVQQEVADMQAVADRQGDKLAVAPWDYRYYAEKVRKAKYDLDQNELKPYLQLDKLREAMFWVAGELFDLGFTPISDVPVYHPDVRVWQVRRKSSGEHVGLWYLDPYARPGKRSGAWMSSYRAQETFRGAVSPIVSNNCNFGKPKPGAAVLVSWDDATTLFHEFGHALHGLCSQVRYPGLSGTAVPSDYVEFPSQLLEHWLLTPEVLGRFALHVETGKPMPPELVAKIMRAKTFNQGFDTVEYLATALIDMKLHLAGAVKIDPKAFERDTLKALGMPEQIVMRHRTPQLSHVFAGDDYAAGYYSYLWADTLSADAYEAFERAGGPYDHAVAQRLRQHVFSAGNTVDPAQAYRAFRGRDPGIDAMMRKRGFAPVTQPKVP